jgi:hypothetical protein
MPETALSRPLPDEWPPLPLEEWRDTCETLHMWSQVVGKIALALTHPVNHFWNVAFQVTPRGLETHPLVAAHRTFTLAFDFVHHQLVIQCSDGAVDAVGLRAQTVADFYHELMSKLQALGLNVRIWTMPVEVEHPIRFEQDVVHRSYVSRAVEAFHRALVVMTPVFEAFRGRFIGKASPVHFFWGSFDLAATRFSGRRAPERPGADAIMRESYSHEVISHGFWPGGGAMNEAAFYGYAVPEPTGLRTATVQPAAAAYHPVLSEFVLPYEAVRRAASPTGELTAFLESTYDAAADLAHWNRRELERPVSATS